MNFVAAFQICSCPINLALQCYRDCDGSNVNLMFYALSATACKFLRQRSFFKMVVCEQNDLWAGRETDTSVWA